MEKNYRTIFGFWALAFLLLTAQIKGQTPGGASGMVFRFTKQVWLNPTIILAKQNFEQSTNVKLLILPRLNGNDTTGSSKIEKAFDKLLSFLVYKENVQGSIKFYFNPKNPTKPFTFNTSDELFCKFTPIQKDSVETILNQDIINSSNLNNFTALPFDSIINRASRYCKKILQSKPGSCGENPGNEFTLTKINSAPAKLNFEKTTAPTGNVPNGGVDKQKYAELAQYYNTVLDVADNSNYPIAWKAMAANKNDNIKLKLKKKQSYFDINKLVFKNAAGNETYNVTYSNVGNDSTIDLSMSGKSPGSMAEVVAYYTPTATPTQTFAIGAFNVQFYESKALNVVLVNLGGAAVPTTADVSASLKQVYGNVFINWTVSTTTCTLPPNISKNIHVENSGLLSNYMPDMQPIVSYFKDHCTAYNGSSDNTFYLLFGATNDGNLEGYMPRARNTGFIFDTVIHTIAHELGHGAFNLKHIFSSDELGEGNNGSTNNIMDYSIGNAIYKHQWDLIHNPSSVGWFEGDDEEAAFYSTQLTPTWKPFTFKGSSTYAVQPVQVPNGAVYGIVFEENNYLWNGTNYFDAINNKILPITINQNPGDNFTIDLFWNTGICGYNKLYTAPWDYIKNKTTFDPSTVTDSRVKFKKNIPCISNDISNGGFRYNNICDNKDLSTLNKDRMKLENLDPNANANVLADTINSVDLCAIRQLSYAKIEPLLKKLAIQTSYTPLIERAILRLLNSVSEDKINLLETNVLSFNSNEILKNLINHMSDGTIILFGTDNLYTSFLETLGYLGSKVNNDQKKWNIINTLIKQRYSNIDAEEIATLEKIFSSLDAYASNPGEVPSLVASFQHLLIPACNGLDDFKIIFEIGIIRNQNIELFGNFTQSDRVTLATGYSIDMVQGGTLNWVIPESAISGTVSIQKSQLWQYYVWSNYLKNHPETELILSNDPFAFFTIFKAQVNSYIANKSTENANYWASLQLNTCAQLGDVITHIRLNENTATLRNVDKLIKIAVINKIFDCPYSRNDVINTTSSLFSGGVDVLTKLVTSFDDNDKDVLVAIENIGFNKIYDALSGDRLSNFCVWAATHAISCGKVKELNTSDAMKANGDITDATNLLKLEADLFQFSNFSANVTKTQIKVGNKSIDYNQMVLVYINDDFTFLEQEFKKGSVLCIPMIQAFAMSNNNRNIVSEKAAWLGVDVLSFFVGIGEVKVFFTAGNYLRKAIVISDLIGTSAGAVVNSLNETAVSPELRFKIQMLSIIASIPQLVTSFKNVNNLVNTTDNAINNLSGISAGSKSDLAEYFNKIKLKLGSPINGLLSTINTIKSKLGFLPSSPLNFTNFIANTGDNFVDIIVHFKNGKYVISKEGALTTELLIDDLANIINSVPSGKSVRLLSCNDLSAAKQLSQLTNKPFYASDGWVELYANGEVRSQNAFHKFENGNQGVDLITDASEISGVNKIRLGTAGTVTKASLITKYNSYNSIKTWINSLDEIVDATLFTKLEGFDAAYYARLESDLSSASNGASIKSLLQESPDDLTTVWKLLKDDPKYSFELAKTGGSRWEKWAQGNFFKTITQAGKDFEVVASNQLQAVSSTLKTKLATKYNININQYEVFEQVQIKTGQTVNGADEYFIADFVLVKKKTVLGQEILDLDNAVVLETKLSSTTPLTPPQTNALAKVKTTSNTFSVRSVSQPGVFNPTNYSLGSTNQIKITDYIKVHSDGVGTTVQDIISLK
ncbi:MAG: hypothetical protein V4506_17405 [Bacteroidota bacterium]